jgi:MFS family permease
MVVLLLAGFAVSSAGNLLTGLSWAVAAAFLVQAVRGLGIAGMDIAATTVLQRIVPPALLGRAFGSLYGAIGVAAALAYLLGGLLLDRTTPRATLVIAGAGGLLATLATAAALRHAIPEPHPGPLPPDSSKEPAGEALPAGWSSNCSADRLPRQGASRVVTAYPARTPEGSGTRHPDGWAGGAVRIASDRGCAVLPDPVEPQASRLRPSAGLDGSSRRLL